jgi:hypothetical protein
MQVEFATPLSADPNLDADDDEEEERWYKTLGNILGIDAVPGQVHRDVEEAKLHAVSVEEPKSLKEADGDCRYIVPRVPRKEGRRSSPTRISPI